MKFYFSSTFNRLIELVAICVIALLTSCVTEVAVIERTPTEISTSLITVILFIFLGFLTYQLGQTISREISARTRAKKRLQAIRARGKEIPKELEFMYYDMERQG
jgi:uncharacterized protein YacL